MNQLDYYNNYNRSVAFHGGSMVTADGNTNGVAPTYDCKYKPIQSLYPQMAAMGSIVPNYMPMIAVRPTTMTDVEYNRWLATNYQYHPYLRANTVGSSMNNNNNMYDPSQQYNMYTKSMKSDSIVDGTSSFDGLHTVDEPQFGPGPPIVTSDRIKGPRGCNLFVFHLPNEITNWDMYLLFRKHGTILSVHTMINKNTGLSKGYGFVSFADKDEAKIAMEQMNGFRLGKKRLKVQLKRSQDDMGVDEIYSSDITGDEGILNNQDVSGVTTRASTPQNKTNANHHSKGIESLTSKLENIKIAHRTMMDSNSSMGLIASKNAPPIGASALHDIQNGNKNRLAIKCYLPTAQDMQFTHTPSKNSISSTSTTTGSPEK